MCTCVCVCADLNIRTSVDSFIIIPVDGLFLFPVHELSVDGLFPVFDQHVALCVELQLYFMTT